MTPRNTFYVSLWIASITWAWVAILASRTEYPLAHRLVIGGIGLLLCLLARECGYRLLDNDED